MHSLAMACVGLVPRPIPEPGLENAGVVGRAGARISGTMPRRRARTDNSYSPLRAAIYCHRLRLGVVHDVLRHPRYLREFTIGKEADAFRSLDQSNTTLKLECPKLKRVARNIVDNNIEIYLALLYLFVFKLAFKH